MGNRNDYWNDYSLTGMILSQMEFDAMMKKYKEKNPDQADIENHMNEHGLDNTSFTKSAYAGTPMPGLQDDDLPYRGRVMYVTEISSDVADGVTFWPFHKLDGSLNRSVRENGTWNAASCTHPIWDSGTYACYIIEADNDVSTPMMFQESSYPTYQDFIQEFKDKAQGYLPENFNWDAHMGLLFYMVRE